MQEEYREVVQAMHEEAEGVLQHANAALFDGGANMATLLAAQEVNEWGSTLAQVAQCAVECRWNLPTLTGVLFSVVQRSISVPSGFRVQTPTIARAFPVPCGILLRTT